MYYHACGQPVTLQETWRGYCGWYLILVRARPVRYCPRCGKRIWFAHLIHPDDMPKKDDATWGNYLDYQDMVRDLGPML